MEKEILYYHREKMNKATSKELSDEICLMISIKEHAEWYKECSTGKLLEIAWESLMDEVLIRAINQTTEPIEE